MRRASTCTKISALSEFVKTGSFAWPKSTLALLVTGLASPLAWSDVAIEKNQELGEFKLRFSTESDRSYQVQKSPDLINWENIGTAVNGNSLSEAVMRIESSGEPADFFRVLQSIDYGNPSDWIDGEIGAKQVDPQDLSPDASGMYTQVAAKAFVWFTGTLEQAYHEPVGEIANYFGFAAMRTEIRDRNGPSSDEGLRSASWIETLEILNADQRQILYDLMDEHESYFWGFFDTRLDLVESLWSLKNGGAIDIPATLALGEKMGRDEAELTVTSAKAYSVIISTLTTEQLQSFNDMRSGLTTIDDMATPGPNTAIVAADIAKLSSEQKDVLTAIGSKLLPWLTGSVDDAVFLPPGKIANYFGFAYYRYVDRANVSRSDAAAIFDSVLDDTQRAILGGLAEDIIDSNNGYVDGRETLIRDSYPIKSGQMVDKASLVTAYATSAGIGETKRSIIEALTFNALAKSMTAEQIGELLAHRNATLEP